MFRYAKNVRLASFLALTCSLRLSLALSGSYWISPCLFLALYGSLWLPLWLSLALTATLWHTLALSGSLLLSNFAYTALDWLTGPLLGSHRRCHDDALYPALLYMNIVSWLWSEYLLICTLNMLDKKSANTHCLASLVEYANPHFKRGAEFLGLDTVHA